MTQSQMTRRDMLRGSLALGAASLAGHSSGAMQTDTTANQDAANAADQSAAVLHERPAIADRRFRSPAIEDTIAHVKGQIADPQLATIFENCLPNTLDTTVSPGILEGKPDTFVITGDIDAMWLRDSSAQVWPYLPFCKDDPRLADLIEGVIRRQTRCIALDPYANAFLRNPNDAPLSWSVHDDTDMKPGVGERKWEIDSLCYTIRLAHGYWKTTGSTQPFDAAWKQSAQLIVKTFREQQRKKDHGPYHFQRASPIPTDTLMLSGYGSPAMPVGMIYSMFRPSDDACIYPLFVPANLFAVISLRRLATMADKIYHDAAFAQECETLAAEVSEAIARHGKLQHREFGEMWAYEVDGYGGLALMDDANAPSLASLTYLECADKNDPLFKASRRFALSRSNPYFFAGSAAEGIGGPHQGLDYIWPMSIMFRAFSSTSDAETLQCLRWLRNTTAGTNFMHESFHKDDAAKYTRPWFAWANGLFGELILHLYQTSPSLLKQSFA